MRSLRALHAFTALCLSAFVAAQNIGINVNGASPHPSALLDIDASAIVGSKRGLLIPRVTSAERIAIAAPATGLVVYDTSTNSFWYYNGTVWIPMLGATTGWSTTGNAGTVIGTNFIGTTDNVPFEVRVNDERAGFVSPGGTATAWGHRALQANSGTGNTGIGKNALVANTTANNNTAVGNQALATNTTGGQNTAVGSQALNVNFSTSNNTAVGFRALNASLSNDNTAVGSEALLFNASGGDNTAVGSDALRVNVFGSENTAMGSSALYTNTGSGNTAMGSTALYANTTGIYNVAVGAEALEDNTSGVDNTAVGAFALWNNTVGVNNTAIGFQAMGINSTVTADYNTAVGYQAGIGLTNQNYNTCVGFQAGLNACATGTLIGAEITQTANTYTNISALGYNTVVDGSNRVRIGNTAVTSIGGYAGWTNLSDGRFKRDVEETVPGLAFITRLRPVNYHMDVPALVRRLGETQQPDSMLAMAREAKAAQLQTGFIAQEVDSVARSIGFDFSGVDRPDHEQGLFGLRYAEFVVPLVKAVQEQNAMIEEQRKLIQQLRDRLDAVERLTGR